MKKILVIDDEAELLELLSFRLSVNKFEVVTAKNKEEALRAIEKKPDLIILDIMMPDDGQGYEIFSDIRLYEGTKNVPVIFLSRRVEDRDRVLEMGGSYFISKPYDGKDLVEKIHLALEGKRETGLKEHDL